PRRAALGALAEAHRAHLRERSDRFRETLANGEDAGDRRRAHRAEADEQHTELAPRRSNVHGNWHEPSTIYQRAPVSRPAGTFTRKASRRLPPMLLVQRK